jgi:hypothetical protein
MNIYAHGSTIADEIADSSESWDWSSPIGLGVFIVAIALTLAILAWTIKTLASIDKEQTRRK